MARHSRRPFLGGLAAGIEHESSGVAASACSRGRQPTVVKAGLREPRQRRQQAIELLSPLRGCQVERDPDRGLTPTATCSRRSATRSPMPQNRIRNCWPGRFVLRAIILASFVLFSPETSWATISSTTRFAIDFTKPKEASKKARWSHPEHIEATEDGLGWEGEANTVRDMWVESEPVAVGLSWRPTHGVGIRAEVDPPGNYRFTNNSVTFPSGSLFVRFSPDAKNWSSWQALDRPTPKDRTDPKQQYVGTVVVPRRDSERYNDYLSQYMKRDVPWASDEEAAVKWILEQEPDFFEKSIPFVGYVQFLYEASLPGGQRLKKLRFEIDWGVGGVHSVPRDEDARQEHGGPWRYRAQD